MSRVSHCSIETQELAWGILEETGDTTISFQSLEWGLWKISSESQIIAAQDQALAIRSIQSSIYGLPVSPLCRVCHVSSETIDHLLSN